MKKFFYISCTFLFSLSLAAQEGASVLKSSLWRSKTISVCWDNPKPEYKIYMDAVQEAVTETWQKNSGLTFTDWCPATEKNADIHIYIEDSGPHTKGLGNKLYQVEHGMVLNFTFENWSQGCQSDKLFCIKAIAVHEFGHALGLAHEQNRKDCTFPNCFDEDQGTNGDWSISACDLKSIMNYCNPKWNNDGFLSELDIEAIKYLYGSSNDLAYRYGNPLKIVQNSTFVDEKKGKNRFDFKVYVTGEALESGKIESVSYDLSDAGKTFKNKVMTSNDQFSNFGIGLTKVWGSFDIKIAVKFKDEKKPRYITHTITEDFTGEEIHK